MKSNQVIIVALLFHSLFNSCKKTSEETELQGKNFNRLMKIKYLSRIDAEVTESFNYDNNGRLLEIKLTAISREGSDLGGSKEIFFRNSSSGVIDSIYKWKITPVESSLESKTFFYYANNVLSKGIQVHISTSNSVSVDSFTYSYQNRQLKSRNDYLAVLSNKPTYIRECKYQHDIAGNIISFDILWPLTSSTLDLTITYDNKINSLPLSGRVQEAAVPLYQTDEQLMNNPVSFTSKYGKIVYDYIYSTNNKPLIRTLNSETTVQGVYPRELKYYYD